MRKSLAAASVAFLFSSMPADAADWKPIAQSSQGTVLYVDISSIHNVAPDEVSRPFEVVHLWIKWDFSKNKTEVLRSSVTLERVNCESETILTLSYTSYKSDGTVKDRWSERDVGYNYKPATPDTLGYAIMEFACGRRSTI